MAKMEITEKELSVSLQEAFACYLAFLSHSQKLRESKLPRQGKGVETTADISNQRYYHIRVAASETCLQYTGRIARSVRRWHSDQEEPDNDDNANVEVDVETLRSFLEEATEDPFVDPFSGKWIQTNASSAGSSPGKNEAATKRTQDSTASRVQRPLLQRQQPYRNIASDYLEMKARSRATRPSLGLHPNAPISPPSPSPSPSPTFEHRTSSVRSSRKSNETPPTSPSSVSSQENDNTSATSEMASAHYSQNAWDSRDKEYAKAIQAQEKRRQEQLERSCIEARRLADRMAREEQARLQQQERYARDLERQEREREERIRRDREAAERTQARWVMENTARDAEPKRRLEDRAQREREGGKRSPTETRRKSEDRIRREYEERKGSSTERKRRSEDRKHIEHEERTRSSVEPKRKSEDRKHPEREEGTLISENLKKVRFGRERSSLEMIKRRSPSVSEEKKRTREAHSIAENHRSKKEVEKSDKELKSKKVDCVSCMEPGNKREIATLPCDHTYCGECITGAFESAYNSKTPFKCCGTTIPTKTLSAHLSPGFIQKYDLLLLELSTKKPTYCSSPTCSKFIPPKSIHGPAAICSSCRTRTCVACSKKEHSGICKEDKDGKKVEELAKRQGWKQCPKCSAILERTEGCLHMTCRCRAEWCYACLRDWNVCKSTCGRSAVGGDYFMGLGNEDFGPADVGGIRGQDETLRRMVERNLNRGNTLTQARAGLGGILPAVAMGLMMAMLDD